MKQSEIIQDTLNKLLSQRKVLLAKIEKCEQELQDTHANIKRSKNLNSTPSYVQSVAFNVATKVHLPLETSQKETLNGQLKILDASIQRTEKLLELSLEKEYRANFTSQVHAGLTVHTVNPYPNMDVVKNKLMFSVRYTKFDKQTVASIAKEMGSDPSLTQALNNFVGPIHAAYRKGSELFIVPPSVESRLSQPPSPRKAKV